VFSYDLAWSKGGTLFAVVTYRNHRMSSLGDAMPTSKEPSNQSSKQSSKPRTSTRTRKAATAGTDTEVPLATAADGNGAAANSAVATGIGHAQGDSLDDRIRQRAYEIYLARGYSNGNELDDWLEAERQLRAAPSHVDGRASDSATA
jgi:hypothetical protein